MANKNIPKEQLLQLLSARKRAQPHLRGQLGLVRTTLSEASATLALAEEGDRVPDVDEVVTHVNAAVAANRAASQQISERRSIIFAQATSEEASDASKQKQLTKGKAQGGYSARNAALKRTLKTNHMSLDNEESKMLARIPATRSFEIESPADRESVSSVFRGWSAADAESPIVDYRGASPAELVLAEQDMLAGTGPLCGMSYTGVSLVGVTATQPGNGNVNSDPPAFGEEVGAPMTTTQMAMLVEDMAWNPIRQTLFEKQQHQSERNIGNAQRFNQIAISRAMPLSLQATAVYTPMIKTETDVWKEAALKDAGQYRLGLATDDLKTHAFLEQLIQEEAEARAKESIYQDIFFDEDGKKSLKDRGVSGDGVLPISMRSYVPGQTEVPLAPRVSEISRELRERLERRRIESGHIFRELALQNAREHVNPQGRSYEKRLQNGGVPMHTDGPLVPVISRASLLRWFVQPTEGEIDPEKGLMRLCKNMRRCLGLQLTRAHQGIAAPAQSPNYSTLHGHVPIITTAPVNERAPSLSPAEAAGIQSDVGCILLSFMTNEEYERTLQSHVPFRDERSCILCHIYEVSVAYHGIAHEHDFPVDPKTGAFRPLNLFSVIVDVPGEYDSSCCLNVLAPWGATGISGFFPRFSFDHYAHGQIPNATGPPLKCIAERGMDFHPSSVV